MSASNRNEEVRRSAAVVAGLEASKLAEHKGFQIICRRCRSDFVIAEADDFMQVFFTCNDCGQVASDLTTILSLPRLKLTNIRVCLRGLTLWANASASVDFVDALS